MRKQLRSNSRKRVSVVTPGGRTVQHFKAERPDYPKCGNCGIKLSAKKMRLSDARTLSKSSKRAERRFPGFCVRCSREALKLKVRGGTLEKVVFGE